MSVLPRGWGWDVMSEISCRRCAGTTFVRNGTVRGHQRCRCKACGCNFTATPERGKPAAMRALAVLLYGLGNASQGMIAELLGVSHVAVYRWVGAAGGIVQIDEMWHFVNHSGSHSPPLAASSWTAVRRTL